MAVCEADDGCELVDNGEPLQPARAISAATAAIVTSPARLLVRLPRRIDGFFSAMLPPEELDAKLRLVPGAKLQCCMRSWRWCFKLIEAATALALLPPKLHEPLADLLGRGAWVAGEIAVRVAGDSSIEIAERQRVAQVTDSGSASGDVTALGGEVDGEVAEAAKSASL